jgi:predicted kinase
LSFIIQRVRFLFIALGGVMPQCTILIGIPGVGKTTWLQQNIPSSHQVISPDQYLEENYDYEWTVARASKAWAVSYQRFAQCLKNTQDVIWDATFLQPIDRSAILHIANGFLYKTRAVALIAPLEVCLERNRKRSRNPVPDIKIRDMFGRIILPTKEEGFDEVVIVRSV